jgi:transcriptional regulator with PAS, ATPase and Fis domain
MEKARPPKCPPLPVWRGGFRPKGCTGQVIGRVETFRDMSLVEELQKELESRFQIGDIVSRNPATHKIFRILPQVAESDSTVLIQGDT